MGEPKQPEVTRVLQVKLRQFLKELFDMHQVRKGTSQPVYDQIPP